MVVGTRLVLIQFGRFVAQLVQPNRTGIAVQLNSEFLAWFESELPGVGMTNQQVAVAVNPGAEVGLTASGPPVELLRLVDRGSCQPWSSALASTRAL